MAGVPASPNTKRDASARSEHARHLLHRRGAVGEILQSLLACYHIEAARLERQLGRAALMPFNLGVSAGDVQHALVDIDFGDRESFRLTRLIRLATKPVPQATSSTRSPSRQQAERIRSSVQGSISFECEAVIGRRSVATELPTTHRFLCLPRWAGGLDRARRRLQDAALRTVIRGLFRVSDPASAATDDRDWARS